MTNSPNHNPNHRPTHDGHSVSNRPVEANRKTAYRDGYVHGRATEQRFQEGSHEVRDNNNAARGLLLGIGLTSLVGLTLGAIFLLNQRPETDNYYSDPVPAAPATPSPSPSIDPNAARNDASPQTVIIERQAPASPTVEQRTTIQRERVIERQPQIIPVPSQSRPSNTTINVTPPSSSSSGNSGATGTTNNSGNAGTSRTTGTNGTTSTGTTGTTGTSGATGTGTTTGTDSTGTTGTSGSTGTGTSGTTGTGTSGTGAGSGGQ